MGASAFVAFAAHLLDVEIAANIAATGEVDAAGKLRPVGDVEAKLALVVRWAPRIRKVIPRARTGGRSRAPPAALLTVIDHGESDRYRAAYVTRWFLY